MMQDEEEHFVHEEQKKIQEEYLLKEDTRKIWKIGKPTKEQEGLQKNGWKKMKLTRRNRLNGSKEMCSTSIANE